MPSSSIAAVSLSKFSGISPASLLILFVSAIMSRTRLLISKNFALSVGLSERSQFNILSACASSIPDPAVLLGSMVLMYSFLSFACSAYRYASAAATFLLPVVSKEYLANSESSASKSASTSKVDTSSAVGL